MNMEYVKGQIVGYVDIAKRRKPIEQPSPQKWYVLTTFPNKETKVMRTFKDRGINAYFPVVRKTEVIRGRRVDRSTALFAGLIFVPDFQARAGGVFVDGVDRYLKFGDYYPYLPESAPPLVKLDADGTMGRRASDGIPDMIGIRWLEAEGNIPVVRRRRLYAIGERVRVVDGPFTSFNGKIERLDSNGRLKVLLDIFKRLTPVELRPIHGKSWTLNQARPSRRAFAFPND
jgi:transcription termination/antitermination protein NusG